MADYWQRFLVPGVIRDYERLVRLQDIAIARGMPRVAAAIDIVIVDLARGLEATALRTSRIADSAIRDELQQSTIRPETTGRTHLRERILSQPLRVRFGEVGIANLAELDKAVNDRSDTPYWRAIEFGLSEGFVGRRLVGAYFQPGGPHAPDAGQFRKHAVFETGGLGEGGRVDRNHEGFGAMTIRNAIKPHRFLERGTGRAARDYLREVNRLSGRTATALDRIVTSGGTGTTRRRR